MKRRERNKKKEDRASTTSIKGYQNLILSHTQYTLSMRSLSIFPYTFPHLSRFLSASVTSSQNPHFSSFQQHHLLSPHLFPLSRFTKSSKRASVKSSSSITSSFSVWRVFLLIRASFSLPLFSSLSSLLHPHVLLKRRGSEITPKRKRLFLLFISFFLSSYTQKSTFFSV